MHAGLNRPCSVDGSSAWHGAAPSACACYVGRCVAFAGGIGQPFNRLGACVQVKDGAEQRLYNMIDVLSAGAMR